MYEHADFESLVTKEISLNSGRITVDRVLRNKYYNYQNAITVGICTKALTVDDVIEICDKRHDFHPKPYLTFFQDFFVSEFPKYKDTIEANETPSCIVGKLCHSLYRDYCRIKRGMTPPDDRSKTQSEKHLTTRIKNAAKTGDFSRIKSDLTYSVWESTKDIFLDRNGNANRSMYYYLTEHWKWYMTPYSADVVNKFNSIDSCMGFTVDDLSRLEKIEHVHSVILRYRIKGNDDINVYNYSIQDASSFFVGALLNAENETQVKELQKTINTFIQIGTWIDELGVNIQDMSVLYGANYIRPDSHLRDCYEGSKDFPEYARILLLSYFAHSNNIFKPYVRKDVMDLIDLK